MASSRGESAWPPAGAAAAAAAPPEEDAVPVEGAAEAALALLAVEAALELAAAGASAS